MVKAVAKKKLLSNEGLGETTVKDWGKTVKIHNGSDSDFFTGVFQLASHVKGTSAGNRSYGVVGVTHTK